MAKINTLMSLYREAGHSAPPLPPRRRVTALTGAYDVTSGGRRTSGWQPGNDSVNTALLFAGDSLRAHSRDMVRKNAWANSAPETMVSETIGSGIVPRSNHPSQITRDLIQKTWRAWTDSADSAGILDFYGLQALILRSVIEGGECFVRLRNRLEKDNMIVPLQLQVLEAEHLPTNKNEQLENKNIVFSGIELDQIGRRAAYWLYPRHPGEFRTFSLVRDSLIPTRVPASQVIHVFKPIRPGQLRGEPWLGRALLRLYDIDQYTDAEVVRKKTAAMFAGFITETDPADPLPGNTSTSLSDSNATAPAGVEFGGIEPGTFTKLRPNESVTFSQPADVGSNYEPFLRGSLREIAKAIGVTYEQLTGDLTGVNYSSIRAGLLEFRRKCEQIQNHIIVFQFCRPIWKAFIEAAVMGGELSARDYAKNAEAYLDVKWIAPGWAWVDPEKEIAAAKDCVRSGFGTRAQEVSARGYDVEEIDRENAADHAREDGLKLIYDTDPRQTANNGMRPNRGGPNPDAAEALDETASPAASKLVQ